MIRFQIPREWRKTTEMMECQSWTIFQRLEKRWGQDHLKRPSRHKTISRDHLTKPSHKTISQDHLTRPSHKTISQGVLTRPLHKTISQGHHTRPSHKTITKDHLTRLFHMAISQDHQDSRQDHLRCWLHCILDTLHFTSRSEQTNKQTKRNRKVRFRQCYVSDIGYTCTFTLLAITLRPGCIMIYL